LEATELDFVEEKVEKKEGKEEEEETARLY